METIFLQSIKLGLRNGLETTFMLGKIIVPVYFFVTILSHTPVIDWIAALFEPVMNLFNIPGEAAIVLVMGNVVGLYAAIGAIQAMSLTSFEVLVVALMLNFSHALFMETAVIRQLNFSGVKTVLLRLSLMLLSGLIYGTLIGGMMQRWM